MNTRLRSSSCHRGVLALLVLLAVVHASSAARAEDCSTLMNPVYVTGSSAIGPFIAKVAASLRALTPPITVVYLASGSCDGVNKIASATPGTLSGVGKIYDNDGKEIAGGCALNNNPVDIGASDVYAASCGVTTLPPTVKDFYGPVQTMTFAVPASSSQNVISAEAAYLVYGFGNDSQVTPWTDATTIEKRSETSGTQQMISAYINVPAAKWQGHSNSASGDLLTSLTTSASNGNAEKAIGILATDVTDKNRNAVKVLGYQHYKQSCAYWPDSTPTAFDKANVRDGHYPMWGPVHLITTVQGDQPSKDSVKKVIDYLSGAVTPTDFDLIALEAKGGVVPRCAMHVTRSSDGGAMSSYQPDKDCSCKFLREAVGTPPNTCKACMQNSDCPSSAPACNYNFCEVK